ncbi:hypothetical protein N9F34_04735 [Alphaproteobacteria bacterium]|nr:hypothetical protein [Alphaproteobacteria bacterium]
MVRKKDFGSLFEGVLNKSPELANKLRDMASPKKPDAVKGKAPEAHPQKEPPKIEKTKPRKTANDRMVTAAEKKRITPRLKPKPAKPQPRPKQDKITKPRPLTRNRRGAEHPVQTYPDRFFEGIPENAHQFGLNDGSKILDIVIGLDFGTSSTKVVVHAPNYTGNPGFAIPFGEFSHRSLEYLLPTRLAVKNDGRCTFSPEQNSTIVTDIKICLMRAPNGSVEVIGDSLSGATPMTAATAYLALVMRYVRGWFLAHKKTIFRDFKINWAVNLGLPAAIDDDPILRGTFDAVGKAAWLISRRPGPITLNNAHRAIQDIKICKFDEEELPWDFALVPEVVAEVTGYARSELRNEGLHFLLDVGASTLDVCAFLLRDKKGDDHFTIFTAEVVLLGAQHLHQARIDGAKRATSECAEELFDANDPLSPITNDLSSYVPDTHKIFDGISRANDNFSKKSSNAVHKIIWHTRKRRDPNSSRWSEVLPIFVCGGAKSIGLYQHVIDGIQEWLNRFIPSCPGVRVIHLPKPTSLEANVDQNDYHRLAVAWGLSHESFNIGTYDRPSEIDDIPPPRVRDISNNFIGKDMV